MTGTRTYHVKKREIRVLIKPETTTALALRNGKPQIKSDEPQLRWNDGEIRCARSDEMSPALLQR
jgi:hypothetical protein